MKKKIITFGMVLVMLFSAMGALSGCKENNPFEPAFYFTHYSTQQTVFDVDEDVVIRFNWGTTATQTPLLYLYKIDVYNGNRIYHPYSRSEIMIYITNQWHSMDEPLDYSCPSVFMIRRMPTEDFFDGRYLIQKTRRYTGWQRIVRRFGRTVITFNHAEYITIPREMFTGQRNSWWCDCCFSTGFAIPFEIRLERYFPGENVVWKGDYIYSHMDPIRYLTGTGIYYSIDGDGRITIHSLLEDSRPTIIN